MKIIRLETENIKRISAVSIDPKGNLVIIGGNNGQGKTSVLDSIEYALNGGRSIPSEPIRKGQESARIVCELDDYVVKRRFTASGNTSLVIENKDGFKASSPQKLLDKLIGNLSFDPLEFSRLKALGRLQLLKKITGVDTTEVDETIADVGKEVKERSKTLKELKDYAPERYDGVEDFEKPVKEVTDRLIKATNASTAYAEKLREVDELHRTIENNVKVIEELRTEIDKLIKENDALVPEHEKQQKIAQSMKKALVEPEDIKVELEEIEEYNRKARINQKYGEYLDNIKAQETELAFRKDRVKKLKEDRDQLVSSAKFPIEGLDFGNGDVLYNGVPFDQASSSEQLRIGVLIGIALNPKLRVLLIRDGSLLDEQSLAQLAQIAEQHDCQVWIERVGLDQGPTAVIIEDGTVSVPK